MNNQKTYIVMKPGSGFHASRQLQKRLQKVERWVLDKGIYNSQNCKELFQNAQQVGCQRLWVGFNQNPHILKQMSQTYFKNLIQIWLSKNCPIVGKNKIESIDILCRLQMPNLQQVHLRQNYINSLKPLRRCNWPQIQVINVYGNKIKDIQGMSELYCPKLTTLWTQYASKNSPQPEDMSWIAKVMSFGLSSICATSPLRIEQASLIKALKCKSAAQLTIYLAEADE